MLYWIVVAAGAVCLLWMADKFGLGQGGEILFSVILVGGAAWLGAEKLNLGFIGVIILLGAVGLYLRHLENRAQERAKAELRRKLGLEEEYQAKLRSQKQRKWTR